MNGGSIRQKACRMQWLFKSKSKDIPMGGIDWLMLGANGIGLVIVLAASLSAHAPGAPHGDEAVRLANLDQQTY